MDKIAPVENLSTDMSSLLKNMLNKEPLKRPTVRQIIDSDFIRSKALLLKIELPKRLSVITARTRQNLSLHSQNLILIKQKSEN